WWPPCLKGASTSYRCRSEPHGPELVTRMTASVGSWTEGSGTVSTRTSRGPCQVSARILVLSSRRPVACGTGDRERRRRPCGRGRRVRRRTRAGPAPTRVRAPVRGTSFEDPLDLVGQALPGAGGALGALPRALAGHPGERAVQLGVGRRGRGRSAQRFGVLQVAQFVPPVGRGPPRPAALGRGAARGQAPDGVGVLLVLLVEQGVGRDRALQPVL